MNLHAFLYSTVVVPTTQSPQSFFFIIFLVRKIFHQCELSTFYSTSRNLVITIKCCGYLSTFLTNAGVTLMKIATQLDLNYNTVKCHLRKTKLAADLPPKGKALKKLFYWTNSWNYSKLLSRCLDCNIRTDYCSL
jgi:predicted transcriptional regulator